MKTIALSVAVALGVSGAVWSTRLPPARGVDRTAVPLQAAVIPTTPVIPIRGDYPTLPLKTGYYGPLSAGSPDLLDRPTAFPINHRNGGIAATFP